MGHDELRIRVRRLMAETFETSEAELPSPADTDNVAAWDSLGHLMLVETVEERFGVAFSQAETIAMLDEDSLVACLAERVLPVAETV